MTRELTADDMKVMGLLGIGFCFSQREDYDLALEWAVRAYNLGRNEAGLAGPCMARSAPPVPGCVPATCTLRAGHLGGHEDEHLGTRWISRRETT